MNANNKDIEQSRAVRYDTGEELTGLVSAELFYASRRAANSGSNGALPAVRVDGVWLLVDHRRSRGKEVITVWVRE